MDTRYERVNNCEQSLHKKWSFTLRISSVNVAKSPVSCGFGHINWRNHQWKTAFFVQWVCYKTDMNCVEYFTKILDSYFIRQQTENPKLYLKWIPTEQLLIGIFDNQERLLCLSTSRYYREGDTTFFLSGISNLLQLIFLFIY